jgi:hypothetical protein
MFGTVDLVPNIPVRKFAMVLRLIAIPEEYHDERPTGLR